MTVWLLNSRVEYGKKAIVNLSLGAYPMGIFCHAFLYINILLVKHGIVRYLHYFRCAFKKMFNIVGSVKQRICHFEVVVD